MSQNKPRIRYRERIRPQSSPGKDKPSSVPSDVAKLDPPSAATSTGEPRERTARASSAGRAARSYEVGFGKPPVATQFQPGRSGNPKGRPKHAKNTRTIVTELLDRTIDVMAQGRTRKMSVREAGLQQIGKRAVEKGDLKSFAFLLNVEGGGLGSPSSSSRAKSAANADSDSLAIGPSAQELEILAAAYYERFRASGLDENQIETVLAALALPSMITEVSGSANQPDVEDCDTGEQFDEA